jgi:hypothetical protein
MRKTLLLTLILLVFAAWAVAQQGTASPSAPTNPQPSQQAVPGENVTVGCLGGSGGNFTVTDKAGTTHQLQLPPNADTAKLNQHVGEEVRVTGTNSPASSSAAGSAPSAGASSEPSIKVTRMEKIADTCGSNPSSANPSK